MQVTSLFSENIDQRKIDDYLDTMLAIHGPAVMSTIIECSDPSANLGGPTWRGNVSRILEGAQRRLALAQGQ